MTPDQFRELALGFQGTTESAHMNHPDFRANGRIFATLAYPDAATGMVKLTAPDQHRLIEMHPQIFYPATGAWGLQGSTMVHLDAAAPDIVEEALELAWQASASAPKKAKKTPR